MTRSRLASAVVLSATLACLATGTCAAAPPDGQKSLEGLTRDLTAKFAGVGQIIPEELERLQSQADSVVVLDVREPDEFAVAHIRGAEWVSPSASARDLAARLGPSRVAGRTVVLYCSVGYRSSKVADRVREALTALGARRVVNLQGGIFAWHNTGRALVDGNGDTVFVHPYDRKWGRYLDFDNLARTSPRE